MRILYMKEQRIFSYRQLHSCFDPEEMLLNRNAFARWACEQFGRMDAEKNFWCNLFLIALMRNRGKLAHMKACMLADAGKMADQAAVQTYLQQFESVMLSDEMDSPVSADNLIFSCVDFFAQEGALWFVISGSKRYQATLPKVNRLVFDTKLNEKERTELFLMLLAGYMLAGCSFDDAPLTAAAAEDGMHEVVKKSRLLEEMENNAWDHARETAAPEKQPAETQAPPAAAAKIGVQFHALSLELPAHQQAHEVLLHPSLSQMAGKRQLPAGTVIRTHCITAVPHALTGSEHTLKLHFYLRKNDKKPHFACEIKVGEKLYVNVAHPKDKNQPPMAVCLLPPPDKSCNLHTVQDITAAAVCEDGYVLLANGKIDASAYHRPADMNFISQLVDMNSEGVKFVEAAFIDGQLHVLTDRGTAYTVNQGSGKAVARLTPSLAALGK